MGQWIEAQHAWMIPTQHGAVMIDDPAEPGTKPIYRIAASDVDAFKKLYDVSGLEFIPLYSDVIELDR